MSSRHASTNYDPYLKPYTRQRSASSSSAGGSPHSFRSNLAVVDGPVASPGQYYGIYLPEPPKGFPVSQVSSVTSSPGGSHLSTSHLSVGTSNGSSHNPSHISMRSSVQFPVVPVAGPSSYQAAPLEDGSLTPMPPSAMKRERRKSFSTSSGSAESVSNKDLRSQCKFVMASISECMKRRSNAPLFSLLEKTDDMLSRIFTILFAMSHDEDLLTPADSKSVANVLFDLQGLLYRALSPSRPHNPDRVAELSDYYKALHNYASRLEISLKINEIEVKIDQLTFRHNVSQESTYQFADETRKAKEDLRSSSRTKRESAALVLTAAHERKAELDAMHVERVALRKEIERSKQDLSKAKRTRDALMGNKSVHFN
ncbi:hypothetical protein CPB86DRAFT_713388 [Serendipita vermifera]|nr:hypothetical protein CPB86DRAFT_713388 [Serendipita vermifera]